MRSSGFFSPAMSGFSVCIAFPVIEHGKVEFSDRKENETTQTKEKKKLNLKTNLASRIHLKAVFRFPKT